MMLFGNTDRNEMSGVLIVGGGGSGGGGVVGRWFFWGGWVRGVVVTNWKAVHTPNIWQRINRQLPWRLIRRRK